MRIPLRGRPDALLVLCTIAISVVLFPGALLHGEAFFERDLHLDWYPRLEAIERSLRAGSWPLWDPSVAFGQPLLADPGAQVAYPGTWLVLLAPRPVAYTLFVVLHLALTAVGAFRLGRILGAGRAGAGAGAAAWLLSGPLQSSVNLWHHFAGACWMPWLVLAADRAGRRPGARAALGLGATGALQALAGSADACVMSWAFALFWVAWRQRGREGQAWRRALAVAGGAALALGLGAVVWRPAADLLSRSPRSNLPEDIRTAWSVPPAGLLRLVVPLDPARVPFSEEAWRGLYDRPAYPFLFSLYVGLPAIALGGAALAWPARRAAAIFLAVSALVALGLALGPHAPVYPILTGLAPPLRIFRYPSKALLLVALATSLAAGLGVGALVRGRLSRRFWGGLGLGLLAASAGAALAAGRFHVASGPSPFLAAAVGIALVLRSLGPLRPRVAALAVAALAVADLLSAHVGLNATAPGELIFRPPPLVSHVDRTEGRRLYVYDYHSLPGTSERLLGRPDPYRHVLPPPGWDSRRFEMVALRLYLPPPSAGLFGLEGSYDLDIRGLYPRGLNDVTFLLRRLEGSPAHAKLLRMGAVGTVASLHTRGLEDLRPVAILESLFPEPIRVWRVPGALPRSWVVGCSRAADRDAALRALADPAFDPTREVILPTAAAGSDCAPAGRSRVVLLEPDRLSLDVQATAPGFAVLADSWDPGWRVTVDGRPAPLLRANVAFRAVAVSSGRHVVEMRYRPRSVLEGLTLSAASLLVLAAMALRGRLTRP